jgi:hypothetical protein
MKQQTSKEDQLMIEMILVEADSWGLRWEVDRDAKSYLQDKTATDLVEAYIWAYEDWIK